MAKNAADSLRWEVPQAKANVSLWIFWRLDVLGGWGILVTLGHPESWVHCWNSSPFWVPPGMGNVFTVSDERKRGSPTGPRGGLLTTGLSAPLRAPGPLLPTGAKSALRVGLAAPSPLACLLPQRSQALLRLGSPPALSPTPKDSAHLCVFAHVLLA